LNEAGRQACSGDYINSLAGKALKSNEDALDSIICLYIAGLYALRSIGKLFGDKFTGYIWVPRPDAPHSI
jgi:predicted RNase H-like nuclease